jgi:hypothetical protein
VKSKTLRIGNIEITFVLPDKNWLKIIDKNYSSFTINKTSSVKVIIQNNFKPSKKPLEPHIINIEKEIEILRSDFHSVSSKNLNYTFLAVEPNKYSFDSWLRIFFSMLALKNNGVLMHASSVNINNSGYIFAGISGSGKSTIIRKFGKQRALSDEISYIFYHMNKLYCASTPFWGELKRPAMQKTEILKVKSLFFLKHSDKLSRVKLNKATAFKEAMKTVLFFSADTKDNSKLMKLAESISETLVFHLEFRLTDNKNKILEAIC